MVKSKATTVFSVAILFLASTSDVVRQAVGASYDLQVHTCANVVEAKTDYGVAAKFCGAEDEECVTSLLYPPLATGASITDGFTSDSSYTFTVLLGNGVSTVEFFVTSDDGWCVDQLSIGPTGGILEQMVTAPVFLDSPCQPAEDYDNGDISCTDSLQYEIAPAVSSTASLYSLTATTCLHFFSSSTATLNLVACEVDDCYELLLYETLAEETPGRNVNGILDNGETVEWRFWLEAPPSELRLSIFGQLGDPTDGWCFSEMSFELPVGGTTMLLSSTDSWVDAPCTDADDYEVGACQLEYLFDLTEAAALTPAPSSQATAATVAVTATPTTKAEEPSPAPSTSSPSTSSPSSSSRGVADSTDTPPPTTEVAITPAPTTTASDTEEPSPAPTTSPRTAADSADTTTPPTTDDTGESVSDQDTSSADGCYGPSTAWTASFAIAVVTILAMS